MAISLYDLSVASFLQTLGGVAGFLQRGLDHFRNTDPSEIVETRLYGDMLPFRFQIVSVAHHSLGAIEGVQRGLFAPPGETPPHDYAALQKLVADARDGLLRLTPDEVNALEGREVPDSRFQDAIYCGGIFDVLLAAQLLFPRHDGIRHPALKRCTARKARLYGPDADEGLTPALVGEACGA
jgi:Domain of unknown function (DUF1993)